MATTSGSSPLVASAEAAVSVAVAAVVPAHVAALVPPVAARGALLFKLGQDLAFLDFEIDSIPCLLQPLEILKERVQRICSYVEDNAQSIFEDLHVPDLVTYARIPELLQYRVAV
jgi:hypothetical protein